MVPTRTGKTGKRRKMRNLFQSGKSQGILSRLEKSGGFTPKYWKIEGILPKILEKLGNVSQFLFLFFSDFLIEIYLLNRFLYLLNSLNKTLKIILENGKKILEKSGKTQGNLSVRKCGNHETVNI